MEIRKISTRKKKKREKENKNVMENQKEGYNGAEGGGMMNDEGEGGFDEGRNSVVRREIRSMSLTAKR